MDETKIYGTYYYDGLECYLQAQYIPHYNDIEVNGHRLVNLALNLIPTALNSSAYSDEKKKEFRKFNEDHLWFFDVVEMFREYDSDLANNRERSELEYYSQQWADKLIKCSHPYIRSCPSFAYPVVEEYLRSQLEHYRAHRLIHSLI